MAKDQVNGSAVAGVANLAAILQSMRPRLAFQGLVGRRLESKGENDGRKWESFKLLIVVPGDEIPVNVTEEVFGRFSEGQLVDVVCLAKSYEIERKAGPKGRGVALALESISIVQDAAPLAPASPLNQGRLQGTTA